MTLPSLPATSPSYILHPTCYILHSSHYLLPPASYIRRPSAALEGARRPHVCMGDTSACHLRLHARVHAPNRHTCKQTCPCMPMHAHFTCQSLPLDAGASAWRVWGRGAAVRARGRRAAAVACCGGLHGEWQRGSRSAQGEVWGRFHCPRRAAPCPKGSGTGPRRDSDAILKTEVFVRTLTLLRTLV